MSEAESSPPPPITLEKARQFFKETGMPLAINVEKTREFSRSPNDPNVLLRLREGYTAELYIVIQPVVLGELSRDSSEIGPDLRKILDECVQVIQGIRARSDAIMRNITAKDERSLGEKFQGAILNVLTFNRLNSKKAALKQYVRESLIRMEVAIVDQRIALEAFVYRHALREDPTDEETLGQIRHCLRELFDPMLLTLEMIESALPMKKEQKLQGGNEDVLESE